MNGQLPFITAVMPVLDEASHIRATLEQLLGQDYPRDRFEIIVADGGSRDGTTGIVEELSRLNPCLRLADNPGRRSSAGRNVGFRLGRGDYFLVVDGHCHIPGRDLFLHVAGIFSRSGADCLGRPQPLDPPGLDGFQKAVAVARASRLGHGADSLIYADHEGFASPVSNGAAYRREVFERIGYVDESFDACEDVEFNWRAEQAGLSCYMSPRLTVKYYPRDTLGGLWRQMARYGRGRFRLFRKHPATLSAGTLIPPLFVIGLAACLAGLALSVLAGSRSAALAFSVPPLSYAALVLAWAAAIAAKHGLRVARHLPAVFFTIHAGLGTGFLAAALGAFAGGGKA